MSYTGELVSNAYGFDDEDVAIGQAAYRIAKKYENESLANDEAKKRFWAELVENGFAGLIIPEEFGGLGRSVLTLCLVMEQTAAAGYPAHKLVLSQSVFATALLRHGTQKQRERWLPRIASGEALVCLGVTEGQTGSNSLNMRTSATRDGDHWVIKGEKTYISGVDEADAVLLAARTPEADNGITIFIVEDPRGRIPMTPVHLNMVHYSNQFTLYLDDLRVEGDSVVGQPGRGMQALFDGLNPERLLVAAQAVGLGRWGLSKAVQYASERKVFSDVIGKYQAIQHPLAEAYTQLEAAWALTVAAARAYDAGGQAGNESNAAKFVACDAGFFAMDRALQTHGGSGFTAETTLLERFMLARLTKTVPVSREMALNHIARSTLGLPKSY